MTHEFGKHPEDKTVTAVHPETGNLETAVLVFINEPDKRQTRVAFKDGTTVNIHEATVIR